MPNFEGKYRKQNGHASPRGEEPKRAASHGGFGRTGGALASAKPHTWTGGAASLPRNRNALRIRRRSTQAYRKCWTRSWNDIKNSARTMMELNSSGASSQKPSNLRL